MDLGVVIAGIGILTGWLTFLETRLYRMNEAFEKRIEERNEVNKVVQSALKEDIARLETKIDMLINLQINARHNNQEK